MSKELDGTAQLIKVRARILTSALLLPVEQPIECVREVSSKPERTKPIFSLH